MKLLTRLSILLKVKVDMPELPEVNKAADLLIGRIRDYYRRVEGLDASDELVEHEIKLLIKQRVKE